MKNIFQVLIGSMALSFLNAQSTKQIVRLIPESQLHQDLDILKSQLEAVHAGLYTYTSKEKMDAAFVNIKEQVNIPMSDIEFYRLVAPLQQKIKNGHSMIIPSEEWDKTKESLPVFPFDVYWYDEKLYVLRNLSDDVSIQQGSLIKTINNELASDVFNDLIDNWTSDGHNRTFPAANISSDFPNFYANIKGVPSEFEIELVAPNGEEKIANVKALLNEKLDKTALKRYNHKRMPWYRDDNDSAISLKISDETAVLKVPSFGTSSKGSNGKKYPKFYTEAFQKIKIAEVKHLILDLRDNGGGDPKPQLALLSNLINEPIVLYKRIYGVTKKISNTDLYDENGASLNKMLSKFLQKDGEVYSLNKLAEKRFGITREATLPSPNVFKGKLYVLTNGFSFSATGEVAGMLKSYRKNIIFIGEETGGNPTQNTSGVMMFMTLPHSKIRVMQSLICFETNVNFENDGYGAKPDYPIKNTIEQELKGEDNVMKWTYDFISKQSN